MQSRYLALSLATLSLLAACGGNKTEAVVPAPPPPPGTVTLTGVAARGAALSGAAVSATCATGTGTATAATNGSYTITITGGALPCVLQATSSDSATVLRSLATGTAASATANVTPLTELLIAQITGQEPAAVFSTATASTLAANFTAAKVAAGQTEVLATLVAAGVNTSGIGDFVTGTLVAANGNTTGNAYDLALDALASRLAAAGTTLAALVTTVANTSAAEQNPTTPPAGGDIASLPADMLLQTAAANCSALRSGKYRLVFNRNRSDANSYDTTLLEVDAALLTAKDLGDGTVDTLTANGNCRYKTPAGGDMVVSQAGVIVVQVQEAGSFHLGVAFPEQTHALADLAGEWNTVQLERTETNGPIHLTSGTWTLDTTGKLTAATFCEDGFTCTSGTLAGTPGFPGISHSVNATGGFNWTNSGDVWVDRVFLYRTGSGELMRVQLAGAGGHLGLSTRKVTRTLPTNGRVYEFWNITQNNDYTASTVTDSKNTVTAVDSTSGSFNLDQVINTTTGVTRPETRFINNPRAGYTFRAAGSATASDGSTSNFAKLLQVNLRGTGITVSGVVPTAGLETVNLSINKP